MPFLSKKLRRLSSGFQVKLQSRENGGQEAESEGKQATETRLRVHFGTNPNVPERFSSTDRSLEPSLTSHHAAKQRAVGERDAVEDRRVSDTPTTPGLTPDTPTFEGQRDTQHVSVAIDGDSGSPSKNAMSSSGGIDPLVEDQDAPRAAVLEDTTAHYDGDSVPVTSRSDAHHYTLPLFSLLPRELWLKIASHLDLATASSLALTNRETSFRIGPFFWPSLNDPINRDHKATFLRPMAPHLPDHLFCEPCARYHARHAPGHRSNREILRANHDYTRKPILASACKSKTALPATRLTLDLHLPFPLAALTMASSNHPSHESPSLSNLSRTWRPQNAAWADIAQSWTVDPTWTHKTRFAITTPSEPSEVPQLLVKVTSTYYPRANLTASEQRLVLSSRKDYTANYTTCAHEAKGGMLFTACKCALGHIPSSSCGQDIPRRASQCNRCRPLYKCMICPTEYQIEVRLVSQGPKFRQALVVTRWTNLGTCKSVQEKEWKACSGELDYQDQDSIIWDWGDGVGKNIRSLWGAATGESTASWTAMPLRRPSHWRSEMRSEIVVAGLES